MSVAFVISFVFAYLLGTIPFGLILTQAAGLGDIRKIGSGNIGATNVLRTGNKPLAAVTLFLDGLKGAVAVLIVEHFAPSYAPLAALAALLGHLFPVWLSFKGGKGVATGIGVITVLIWPAGLVMMAMWVTIAKRLHLSSLAALVAFGFMPLDVMIFGRTDLVPLTVAIAALVFYKHKDNIRRLLNHTEPKIGSNASKSTSES